MLLLVEVGEAVGEVEARTREAVDDGAVGLAAEVFAVEDVGALGLGRGEGGGGCVDMLVVDQCSWMEKVNRPAKPVARARVAKILRDIVMVISPISTEKSVLKVVKRLNVTDVCIIR